MQAFNLILPSIQDKAQIVKTGDAIEIDNAKVEIVYHFAETYNFAYRDINETSIAFKRSTNNSSVIFLGDLAPEGGDILLKHDDERKL